jgi:hypothetical protein
VPFGANVVCFISQGMEHDLMTYSFNLCYVFALVLFIEAGLLKGNCNVRQVQGGGIEQAERIFPRRCNSAIARYLLPVVMGVLLFNNIVYANQAYLYKELVYQNTLNTMNRIIDRMEETEGYVAGETPVAFVGTLRDSSLMADRDEFAIDGTGLESNSAVTYYLTYGTYFKYLLGYPINMVSSEEAEEWSKNQEVVEMSPFPAQDSCKMIDGTMVVKLS